MMSRKLWGLVGVAIVLLALGVTSGAGKRFSTFSTSGTGTLPFNAVTPIEWAAHDDGSSKRLFISAGVGTPKKILVDSDDPTVWELTETRVSIKAVGVAFGSFALVSLTVTQGDPVSAFVAYTPLPYMPSSRGYIISVTSGSLVIE